VRVPPIARLVSIPEIARRAGVSRWTAQRRLLRLHRAAGGDWLFSPGPRAKMLVNLSRLMLAHPDWAEARPIDPADFEELESRVYRLEKSVGDERALRGRTIARVRALEEATKRVQSGAIGGARAGSL
jgi:hypothetical protein